MREASDLAKTLNRRRPVCATRRLAQVRRDRNSVSPHLIMLRSRASAFAVVVEQSKEIHAHAGEGERCGLGDKVPAGHSSGEIEPCFPLHASPFEPPVLTRLRWASHAGAIEVEASLRAFPR